MYINFSDAPTLPSSQLNYLRGQLLPDHDGGYLISIMEAHVEDTKGRPKGIRNYKAGPTLRGEALSVIVAFPNGDCEQVGCSPGTRQLTFKGPAVQRIAPHRHAKPTTRVCSSDGKVAYFVQELPEIWLLTSESGHFERGGRAAARVLGHGPDGSYHF